MAPTASESIPPIAQPFVSDRARKLLDIVEKFVDEECIPADAVYQAQIGLGEARWQGHPSVVSLFSFLFFVFGNAAKCFEGCHSFSPPPEMLTLRCFYF